MVPVLSARAPIRRPVASASGPTAGYALWLKADALVLSDGDPVTTWTDSSGNGHDFTQAASGARPTYKSAIINGKPVVRFSIDHELVGGDLSAVFPTAATLIVVAKPNNTAGYSIYTTDGDVTDSRWRYVDGNTYISVFRTNRVAGANPPDMPTSGTHVYSVTSAGNYSVGVDGVVTAFGALHSFQSGTNHRLGNSRGDWFDGDIAELLIYPSALSDTDRIATEAYLASKYAL